MCGLVAVAERQSEGVRGSLMQGFVRQAGTGCAAKVGPMRAPVQPGTTSLFRAFFVLATGLILGLLVLPYSTLMALEARVPWVGALATWLDSLTAAVDLIRPLLLGHWPHSPLSKIAILLVYCAAGFYVASVLTRRRLLK